MPFFSIVIPAYNRSHFLIQILRTLLKQRFTDFEVILVDDGSTDDTAAMIRRHQMQDNRIKYIYQANSERGTARNAGFKNSSSDYVVFLDSDDLMHEDHLHSLYNGIHRYQFPNFVATKHLLIRDGMIEPSDTVPMQEGKYDYRLFLNGNPVACNVCVKRNNPGLYLFEENRELSGMEDWLFMIQNLKAADDRLVLLDRITITMTDHDERSMRSDHQSIIYKSKLAKEWIKKNVSLSDVEMEKVASHTYYFSAIYSYVDHRRLKAAGYLFKAVKSKNISLKHLVLFAKIIVGRKLFKKLRLSS